MIAEIPVPRIRDDLHKRVELVSMDGACRDITVALYLLDDGQTAIVHSYSTSSLAAARLGWLAGAMRTLAELVGVGTSVRFPCGVWHEKPARRAFLDAAKLDPSVPVEPRPLGMLDSRTDQQVTATPLGEGVYRIASVALGASAPSRASAVAAGLVKLADVDVDGADDTVVSFRCGASHDALIGLILPRAVNVRSALREQEMAASRGVLLAPSAQRQAADG